jgi:hypothetical protein
MQVLLLAYITIINGIDHIEIREALLFDLFVAFLDMLAFMGNLMLDEMIIRK